MLLSIKNYYEQLVHERFIALAENSSEFSDAEYTDDVACVALNKLPSRYVRHSVDLSSHMTDDEWQQARKLVEETVAEAINFVRRRQSSHMV